jgi:hypothetical protein
MADFPVLDEDVDAVISTAGPNSTIADYIVNTGNAFNTSGTWPANNLGIYCPVWVSRQVTVYQMSYIVATQSGNYDIGIYDNFGNRLVSSGSQTVPAAGIALRDITDTVIGPGAYFLALSISTTVASIRRSNVGIQGFRACGILQQAIGAVTLPDPFTGVALASAYCPYLTAHLRATV